MLILGGISSTSNFSHYKGNFSVNVNIKNVSKWSLSVKSVSVPCSCYLLKMLNCFYTFSCISDPPSIHPSLLHPSPLLCPWGALTQSGPSQDVSRRIDEISHYCKRLARQLGSGAHAGTCMSTWMDSCLKKRKQSIYKERLIPVTGFISKGAWSCRNQRKTGGES